MRGRGVALVWLAAGAAALTVLLALVGNAATSDGTWPGEFDRLRRDPWPWLAGLGLLASLMAAIGVWVQERVPTTQGDPPPPPPDAVPSWFVDRAQTRAAVVAVCRGRRAVGITTSLWGAGGFGKTTLAVAVGAHPRVRRRFRSRVYTVTIGRDVRGRTAMAAKVAEVTRFVTGDASEFPDPDLAGAHLGRLLDKRPRTLLILDDVWESEQLAPFLRGGHRCVRLVTTRNPELLPADAQRIQVDQMSSEQAGAMLTWQLSPLPRDVTDGLLQATGRWALLLRLTNRLIAEQTASGANPAAAAERILLRLRAHGPATIDAPSASWDMDDPRLRSQAVTASIEAAVTLLPAEGADRFAELGVFAEDETVPISVVAMLWHATGDLTEEQTRVLCRRLQRLSLLTLDARHDGRISLHDVIRDYLRGTLDTTGLIRLNSVLIDSVAATLPTAQPLAGTLAHPEYAWWRLRHDYLLDHLVDHLIAADRALLAEAVASDVRWVEARLAQRGPSAPWNDLARIEILPTRSSSLTRRRMSLARSLAQAAHLLTPTDPPGAVIGVLHNRLDTHPQWRTQIAARRRDSAVRPCLVNRWPLPDLPSPALHRTLAVHPREVSSLTFARDGTWFVTVDSSFDGSVRIWNRATGACSHTLTSPKGRFTSVAVFPDGNRLATGESDGTVRIWSRATGECTGTFKAHKGGVFSVAVSSDGLWLVTGGSDGAVRVWDPAGGSRPTTLTGTSGHTKSVDSVAIFSGGSSLVTVGDGSVRIWDRATGSSITLAAYRGMRSAVLSQDGARLAVSGSEDGLVRTWFQYDFMGGDQLFFGGPSLRGEVVAVSPDGAWLVTGGHDGSVQIWDASTGGCTDFLTGQTGSVTSVAISPDGRWILTGGSDGSVRIWDHDEESVGPEIPHSGHVMLTAVSSDGTRIATVGRHVQLWNGTTRACTATLTESDYSTTSLAMSPNGAWVATASSDDGLVKIWETATGNLRTTVGDRRGSKVTTVAIAPDGTWIATGTEAGTLEVWDGDTGTRTSALTVHSEPVTSVAISSDGVHVATVGSQDEVVRIWERTSGSRVAVLRGHTGTVTSVAFSPAESYIATTGKDRMVRLWDPVSGTCIGTLTGHAGSVTSVAISPDGRWIATTSTDRTVRVWRAREMCTVAIARTEGQLLTCAWAKDHDLIAGGTQGIYVLSLLI